MARLAPPRRPWCGLQSMQWHSADASARSSASPGLAGGARTSAAATIVDAGASYVQLSLYAHSAQKDCVRAELVGRAA